MHISFNHCWGVQDDIEAIYLQFGHEPRLILTEEDPPVISLKKCGAVVETHFPGDLCYDLRLLITMVLEIPISASLFDSGVKYN